MPPIHWIHPIFWILILPSEHAFRSSFLSLCYVIPHYPRLIIFNNRGKSQVNFREFRCFFRRRWATVRIIRSKIGQAMDVSDVDSAFINRYN